MRNRFLLASANSPLVSGLIMRMEQADARSTHLLRVLTYHRVAEPDQTPHLYPRVTVTPAAFEAQLRYLEQAFQVVSMKEVIEAVRTGAGFSRRAVLITFDDAYRDFAENALPVLKRYHMPATLFVPTAFPDHPERAFWWDRLYTAVEHSHDLGEILTPAGYLPVGTRAERREVLTVLRDYVKSIAHGEAMQWVDHFCREVEAPECAGEVLSWDELRAVAAEGITLGAHTRTHPMMPQISRGEIRAEIAGSLDDLRREIGETLPIFAYPSGGYTGEVIDILKEEGCEFAFTTRRGHNDLRSADWLQAKRINVGPNTSLNLLRAQLLGWVSSFL